MSRTMSGIPTSGGGGDGDAVLAGGTTASPQIFTGVNEFNGATNGDVGLIEQTATYNNSFIQTSGEQTNFIRQNGTTQGYIVQEADDSVIKQEGEDAEILQEGDNADFKQQGDGCRILQLGQNAQITQSGLNSVISSPRVRCSNLPLIGNDLCNKTYVDGIGSGFATKTYVDGFNEVGFEGNFSSLPVVSYAVGQGNPTTASGGDSLNGRMDTPQGFLNADITIPATGGAVKIDICITGEWSNISWDKGVILARAEADPDGTFPNPVVYQALIRANLDTTSPNSGRYIIPFLATFGAGQDNGSTLESATGFVIDFGTGVVIGKTYRYTPVLINTSVTHTFKLNRVINSTNNVGEERTVSSIVASILKV